MPSRDTHDREDHQHTPAPDSARDLGTSLSGLTPAALDAFVRGYLYALRGGTGLAQAVRRLGRPDLAQQVREVLSGHEATRAARAALTRVMRARSK